MEMADVKCKMCGKCCRFEIPLTLLDIHRISKAFGLNEEAVFRRYIQSSISEKSGLFKMRKNDDSTCILLTSEKKCLIQEEKPNVCSFYQCNSATEDGVLPWTVTYSGKTEQSRIWEQSVASEITKKYIQKNLTNWDKNDFEKALISIQANILTKESQRIKLARNGANDPICMIYDCSTCKKAGTHAVETPITLDDISRIAGYLQMKWEVFFKHYLSEELSSFGIFKLKRDIHCIFFHAEKHCTIKNIRPMHCRFTPCPKKTRSSTQFDCFYLGSGTIEEQFRHQAAILFAREYSSKYGTRCNVREIKRTLDKMNEFLLDKHKFKDFSKNISNYRYI